MQIKGSGRKRLIVVAGVAAALVVGAAIGLFVYSGNQPKATVQLPDSVKGQLTFPVYLPTKLPGAYRIQERSFSFDGGVLIFKAQAESGETIAFTEQAKPDGFDFANFYSEQLTDAKTLDNVPFASVTGKNQQDYNVLSVVTDKTWVLISSRSPLAQSDMQNLASGMKLQ